MQKILLPIDRPIKVQIVSRYIPVENTAGNATYLLDIMRYLRQTECSLELVVLDQWAEETTISQTVRDIADVHISKPSQMAHDMFVPRTKPVGLKDLLRHFYRHLPWKVLHPMRKMFYHLRGEELSDIHAWDALPTKKEMEFFRSRYREWKPDVVIVNYTFLSDLFKTCSENQQALKVILTHDIRHQRVGNYQQTGFLPDDLDWNWDNESEQLRKADVLLAIQQDDARMLKDMAPQSDVICVPMSGKFHPHNATNQVPGRCLFVASKVVHNVHGLQWFLNEVWPLILQSVPHCNLNVCGTICEKILGAFPHVKLLGRVEDIDSEYAAAEVCLIPLVVGSGLKIKLVEALSHGHACVSTSVGVQGIQEITNRAVLVADSAEDFAEAVVTILNNPKKRKDMEEQARKYVKDNLSPERVYQPFVDRIYQHLHQNNNMQ